MTLPPNPQRHAEHPLDRRRFPDLMLIDGLNRILAEAGVRHDIAFRIARLCDEAEPWSIDWCVPGPIGLTQAAHALGMTEDNVRARIRLWSNTLLARARTRDAL